MESEKPGIGNGSNDGVLWFEYLLDPSLLEKQLKRENSETLATDLMIEFLINSQNNSSGEKCEKVVDVENIDTHPAIENKPKKSLALKILALKCASYLKWNFQLFGNQVPLTLQQILFQDLLYFASNGKIDTTQHFNLDFATISPHLIFAISMYHRWVLWALRTSQIITKPKPILHIPMPGGQGPTYVPPHIIEVLLRSLDSQLSESVQILENILLRWQNQQIVMPSIDTFINLTENSTNDIQHHWELGYPISRQEFELQLHYDLAVWFMFANQHVLAKNHFSITARLYEKCSSQKMDYCTISPATLKGFTLACQIPDASVEKCLTERMYDSIKNDYIGLLDVFQEDNIRREIPIHYRDMTEMELLNAVSSSKFTVAKDFMFKVQTLNAIRKVLDHRYISESYFQKLRSENLNGVQFFITAIERVVDTADKSGKKNVKSFLLKIRADSELIEKAICQSSLMELLKDEAIKKKDEHWNDVEISLDFPRTLLPQVECGELVERLIESYSLTEIQSLLNRLSNGWPNRALWMLYKKWEIPIPLQSVVMNLPKGLIQDWSYILLAKSREMVALQDFKTALEMLKAVELEVRGRSSQLTNFQASYKFFKLIEWEILLVDVMEFLHKWPKCSNSNLLEELATKCRGCLGALHRGETILPRSEIVEHCVAFLLTAMEWEFLLGLDLRWNLNLELASNLAAICYDLQRNRDRPNRKISRSLWDLIVPVFNTSIASTNAASQPGQGIKRNASGVLQSSSGSSRDSPNASVPLVNRAALVKFCQLLCEPQSLTVMLSLFSRLHNVVQDEANLEINSDLSSLWPAVLSNSNNYYLPAIGEMLMLLLERALSLYPLNTSWLKLQGDLYFAQNFHSSAMSSYLTAAAVSSNHFNQPVPRSVLDEPTIRRMIRCSHVAQCFTQAAILCQFLDEVDYATAFRCLQERNCNDAMDSFYSCIWDITMLEYLVHLHCKRGETQRKIQAVKVMGMLELNTNNNEEIQRESITQRKAQFLRALTKQYL